MPNRKIRAAIAASGLVILFGASFLQAEPVTLTLPQVDAMARQALAEGHPKLAFSLSRGLLEADPKNGQAHYYQAVAMANLREFGPARRAAARAYRLSNSDVQRFQSARLAAQLSFAGDKLTGSQLWLRRAVEYAPDEVTRAQTVNEYRNVRRRNPLNFNFRFSVTPSDNVNNGANSPLNVINGVPVAGTNTVAESGIIATSELQGSLRLSGAKNHETRLTGMLSTRHVDLSDPVAGQSGEDFGFTIVEAGIRHALAGPDGSDMTWRFDGKGGRVWYGGDPLYNYLNLGVQQSRKLTEKLALTFGGDIEQQFGETSQKVDTTILKAFGSFSYSLPKGDKLGFYLQYRNADSDGFNRTSQQVTAVVSYKIKQQLGPAQLSFTLGHSTLDYEEFSVFNPATISLVPLAGGRTDQSTFGSINATFNDWGYMGFVPTVSIRTEKSRSNISLYDVDETSFTVGIRSEF